MHDSLSTEEGGSEADDYSTSDRGGAGVADELDDGLARLKHIDVTWGTDLDAVLQKHAQQVPAAGDDRDGTTETMSSSRGGAVDASSGPVGRAGSTSSGKPLGMRTLNSPLFSSTAGLPANMAMVSSVVHDVLFSIHPDFVHSCAAAGSASATSGFNLYCSSAGSLSGR